MCPLLLPSVVGPPSVLEQCIAHNRVGDMRVAGFRQDGKEFMDREALLV